MPLVPVAVAKNIKNAVGLPHEEDCVTMTITLCGDRSPINGTFRQDNRMIVLIYMIKAIQFILSKNRRLDFYHE